ncbi:SRPBCC domain-containing protein [Frankia sp. Cas4]|uniref:SRPBCC family protein n=1 Tax=Frankia sp. Cas4 TaxID=3073927 RepID=UPI002AD29CD5|nr:SRPBCC domain-containing protein [Frankia sp. Cas4]
MSIDQLQPTDYQKSIRLQASASAVFDAVTTVASLSAWWTRTTGSGDTGGELRFYFNSPVDACVMHVEEASRPTRVQWTVTECAFLPDWVGTHPTFTITAIESAASELHFRHHGLTSELDCIEMCTLGWDTYLGSLRRYVETGEGSPFGSA